VAGAEIGDMRRQTILILLLPCLYISYRGQNSLEPMVAPPYGIHIIDVSFKAPNKALAYFEGFNSVCNQLCEEGGLPAMIPVRGGLQSNTYCRHFDGFIGKPLRQVTIAMWRTTSHQN